MGDLEQWRDREVFREIGPGTVEEKVGEVGSWSRVFSHELYEIPTCKGRVK